jgi:hypothetical protein
MMKSILLGVFVGAAVLLGISSCATVPTEPLGEGELRLLEMQVPENGNLIWGLPYKFNISFEADGHPEIIRAACLCSNNGPYYNKVEDVKYGSEANFNVYLLVCDRGSQRLECYVDYVRDGKRRRSNSVSSLIYGIER